MGKPLLSLGIVLVILFVAATVLMLVPIKTCTVSWVDRENRLIQGLYDSCPDKLHTRRIAGQDYAQIGTGVFRVERLVQRSRGAGLRPHHSELLVFIKDIDGPAELEKLQASGLSNNFLSDGTHQFLNGYSLALEPPVDFDKLEPVQPASSMYSGGYLTDGRYVFFEHEVVRVADAASFRGVRVLRNDGLDLSPSDNLRLAVDKHAAYYSGRTIAGADPATFEAIAYSYRDEAPRDVVSADRNACIAFDSKHAWRVDWRTIERVEVTQARLAMMRADLRLARASAAMDQAK
jgi:hypothetical protein